MSYRPSSQARKEHVQRNDGWQSNSRKGHPYSRPQGKNSSKFFSESWISKRKPFLRLFCPHCHTRCLTFLDYKKHLHAEKHLRAMSRRILFIEREIETRRKEQATAQGIADKAAQMQGTSSAVVKYCAVCDLNFYQEESKHISSKLHADLQKLLEPRCNICSYQAKDAVDYENHICSIHHLKREEGWTGDQDYDNHSSEDTPAPSYDSNNDAETSSNDKASTSSKATVESSEEGNRDHAKITMHPNGDRDVFIKEALYCSCCDVYFNCEEGQEAAKVKHCKTQQHLEMWIKLVEQNHKPKDGLHE